MIQPGKVIFKEFQALIESAFKDIPDQYRCIIKNHYLRISHLMSPFDARHVWVCPFRFQGSLLALAHLFFQP
jgi:hypothetical protein